MDRLPSAARTLIRQVTEKKARTKVERVGEADGLGVVRTIRFNPATGKWLKPLLEEMADPRVQSLDDSDKGLEVTFVASTKADNRHDFPLDAAETVLGK